MVKQFLISCLLLSTLWTFELFNHFNGEIFIDKFAFDSGNLALADKNTAYIVDLNSKKILYQKSFDYDILSVNFYDDNFTVLLKSFDKILDDKAQKLFDLANFDCETLLVPNKFHNFYLISNKNYLLKFNSNFSNLQKVTLPTSVKIKSAYALNNKIYLSFFDRNLAIFDENLTLENLKKEPFLISAFANLNGEILKGNQNGEIIFKDKKTKISTSQIDALAVCSDKIYIGDWDGNLYIYDGNLEKNIDKKHLFDDRLRALFCSEMSLIAISWSGEIAVLSI